jgi:hypothetical protein
VAKLELDIQEILLTVGLGVIFAYGTYTEDLGFIVGVVLFLFIVLSVSALILGFLGKDVQGFVNDNWKIGAIFGMTLAATWLTMYTNILVGIFIVLIFVIWRTNMDTWRRIWNLGYDID